MITEELLKRYLAGNCTAAEQEQIAEWYASFDNQPPYFVLDQSPEANALKEQTKAVIQSLIASHTLQAIHTPAMPPTAVISTYKTPKRMVAYTAIAAAILIVFMGGIFGTFSGQNLSKKELAQQTPSSSNTAVAIMPGSNKAILTLADGSAIVLDSAQNGVLTEQGNAHVVKNSNGELVYKTVDNKPAGAIAYNKLSTPRGGQFMLTLPDNSKVWLNAASSIKYPTVFAGNERRVEITGEAYFEVAAAASPQSPSGEGGVVKTPFIVKIITPSGDGGEVQVLGTHFNINAYNDEGSIKTTLLEGKVKVSGSLSMAGNQQPVTLKPGEQALITSNHKLEITDDVDLNQVMAWKNGLFQFDDVTIQTVLNQVARWYDVEVVYERDVSKDRFKGKIYRNTDIAKLLNILELSGAHFKIEGKRVIVQ